MEKGAYIYYDEQDNIDLLLFMKCGKEDLHKALPMNSRNGEILNNHDTLQAIFHRGYDYLGSTSIKNIPELIEKLRAVDLINNNLSDLHNQGFLSLTESAYNNMKNFSKNQLGFNIN